MNTLQRIVIKCGIVLAVLLIIFSNIILCRQVVAGEDAAITHETAHEPAHEVHHSTVRHEAEHGDAHIVHEEHHEIHPTPNSYYFYWGILIVLFIISFGYLVWVRKIGKPKHESLILAGFLVFLVLSLYLVGQLPSLHGYFSVVEGKFISGYHEPSTQGTINFLYKVIVCILLVIYSFLGMHEHHEENGEAGHEGH